MPHGTIVPPRHHRAALYKTWHTPTMPYPTWLPILLGFLSAVGPLSTDMYLPAFPAIEASLGGRPGTAQITLATWFVGLAIGQITQGTLADRYGRRTPLIAGTLLYTIASAGCALAPNLATLATLRFISAFGASASMVIPRAIIRDLADGHAAAHLMSRLMLVMGAAPILAPTLGGLILGVAPPAYGWHAIFWFTTTYGAIGCALVYFFMPDTLPQSHRIKLGLGGIAARFVNLFHDRTFLGFALTGGFSTFGMFAYIGGSSPVFIQHFGFTPPQYGMLFGISAGMFIVATQINPRILPRFGAPRIIRTALATYLAATAAMLLFALLGRGGPLAVVLPIMLALFAMGFIIPNTTVGALSRHAAQAGSASALMGTLQFGLAACSGLLVGLFTDGTPRPMAALLCLGAALALAANRLRPRKTNPP